MTKLAEGPTPKASPSVGNNPGLRGVGARMPISKTIEVPSPEYVASLEAQIEREAEGLRAKEVERLTAELEAEAVRADGCQAEIVRLTAELEQLRLAQAEWRTVADDVMTALSGHAETFQSDLKLAAEWFSRTASSG